MNLLLETAAKFITGYLSLEFDVLGLSSVACAVVKATKMPPEFSDLFTGLK